MCRRICSISLGFTRAFLHAPLFAEADIDQSGCIDHAEFGALLRHLGRDIGPDVARHCIARCAFLGGVYALVLIVFPSLELL